MQIYNLSSNELKEILKKREYSKQFQEMLYFGGEDILEFYYKDFMDFSLDNIDESIESEKKIWNKFEFTWEHYKIMPRIALINRLEELQGLTKLGKPVITGLALYRGYPAGVFVPRLLTYYKNIGDPEIRELSLAEKKEILEKVDLWVEELIKRDVYPNYIYGGNIVVNKDEDLDVALVGLDESGVVRIETKTYVEDLKNRGRDLENETHKRLSLIKNQFLK